MIKDLPEEQKVGIAVKNETKKLTLTEKLAPQLKAFGLTPQEAKISFLKAVSRNPELAKVEPESAILSIAQAKSLGLSIDPIDGQVALIPYKQGMKSVAQLQIMWKGYREIVLNEAVGVKELIAIEVKEGDIISYDFMTGEFLLNDNFWSKDFKYHMERKAKPTIGFLGLMMLEEKVYKQKTFGAFMDLNEINDWKINYGSKTKITDDIYGKKTVIKKVVRDFKHKINWNREEKINIALVKDQSAQLDGKTIYVEKG